MLDLAIAITLAFLVGFGVGFGVREWISRARRRVEGRRLSYRRWPDFI
jgi:hypothetical protein